MYKQSVASLTFFRRPCGGGYSQVCMSRYTYYPAYIAVLIHAHQKEHKACTVLAQTEKHTQRQKKKIHVLRNDDTQTSVVSKHWLYK